MRAQNAKLGLIGEYNRQDGPDPWKWRWFIHRLYALPFAPTRKVRRVYARLKAEISDLIRRSARVRAFLAYFEQYWLSRQRSLTIWNLYGVLSHRTNNNLEGTHYLFLALFGLRPNMWQFAEVLQGHEEVTMVEEERHKLGHAPAKRRKEYRDKEARLKSLRDVYKLTNKSVTDTFNYVCSVSKLFRYNINE